MTNNSRAPLIVLLILIHGAIITLNGTIEHACSLKEAVEESSFGPLKAKQQEALEARL